MLKILNWRKLHRFIAPIIFLPLLLTTITGVMYRVGRTTFGVFKDDTGELLLKIHDGSILGKGFSPFYVFLDGIGLIGLLVTGIFMLGMFAKKRRRPTEDV